MIENIWECMDDKSRYLVKCERVSDRVGMLKLIRLKDGVEVRNKSVSLAYGARFGPDVSDVNGWNRMATAWADELDAQDNHKE